MGWLTWSHCRHVFQVPWSVFAIDKGAESEGKFEGAKDN